MKIFYIRENTYCRAGIGFSFKKFDAALDMKLHMRKNSFAEFYSKKIFHALFQNAFDLKQEYKDYYAEEYESFERYLYQKKLWDMEDIHKLNLTEGETVLELSPTQYSYSISNLLDYEESGVDIINEILEGLSL